MPAAGVLFFVGALALAGIPPTNGFVSKMLLFGSGIESAQFWALFLIGLASILTMIYTIRAFQRIWWQKAPPPQADGIETSAHGDRLAAPLVLIGLVLILGLWAEPLIKLAQETSLWLGDPTAYIQAVLGGG
jgi:multicomponent Na+:H+ antiporter subunit D